MAIIAKAGGTAREPAPVGNHVARCVRIIQIGTVEQTWEGKVKQVHKVRISFELPHEKKVFDEAKGEQPIMVDIPRTLSLNRNARLRAELESWRGRPFTEEEAEGFDISALIGVPCMLNIIHTDEGYERVHAITPVPKGMEVPAQVNPSAVLSYDNWNQALYDSMPDFIKKDMMSSPEYKQMFGTTPGPVAADANNLTAEQKDALQHKAHEEKTAEQPDDLPF